MKVIGNDCMACKDGQTCYRRPTYECELMELRDEAGRKKGDGEICHLCPNYCYRGDIESTFIKRAEYLPILNRWFNRCRNAMVELWLGSAGVCTEPAEDAPAYAREWSREAMRFPAALWVELHYHISVYCTRTNQKEQGCRTVEIRNGNRTLYTFYVTPQGAEQLEAWAKSQRELPKLYYKRGLHLAISQSCSDEWLSAYPMRRRKR